MADDNIGVSLSGDASNLNAALREGLSSLQNFATHAQQFEAAGDSGSTAAAAADLRAVEDELHRLTRAYQQATSAKNAYAASNPGKDNLIAAGSPGNVPLSHQIGGEAKGSIENLQAIANNATQRLGSDLGLQLQRMITNLIHVVAQSASTEYGAARRTIEATRGGKPLPGATQRSGLLGPEPKLSAFAKSAASQVASGKPFTPTAGTIADAAVREERAARARKDAEQAKVAANSPAPAAPAGATPEQLRERAGLEERINQLLARRQQLEQASISRQPLRMGAAGPELKPGAAELASSLGASIAPGLKGGKLDQGGASRQLEEAKQTAVAAQEAELAALRETLHGYDQRISAAARDRDTQARATAEREAADRVYNEQYRRVSNSIGLNTRTGNYEETATRTPLDDRQTIANLNETFGRRPSQLSSPELQQLRGQVQGGQTPTLYGNQNLAVTGREVDAAGKETLRLVNLRNGYLLDAAHAAEASATSAKRQKAAEDAADAQAQLAERQRMAAVIRQGQTNGDGTIASARGYASVRGQGGTDYYRLNGQGTEATKLDDGPARRQAIVALEQASVASRERARAEELLAAEERGEARRIGSNTIAHQGQYYGLRENGNRATELSGFAEQQARLQDPRQRSLFQNFLGGLSSRGFGGGNGGFDLGGIAQSAGTTVKYTALYSALNLVQQGAAQAAAALLNYEDSIAGITLAYKNGDEPSQSFINSLQNIAAQNGLNVGDVMDQAAIAMRTFGSETNQTTDGLDAFAVKFSAISAGMSMLTGDSLTETSNNLRAATTSQAGPNATLDQAAQAAATYADATSGASKNFGADLNDVAIGYRAIATTAKQAGFSANETANLVAVTTSRLGESGQLAGTRLQRVFSIIAGSAGQNALKELNQSLAPNQQINTSGTVAEQVRELSSIYGDLTKQQQAGLTNALGGTANTGELVTVLQLGSQALEQNGKAFDYAGAYSEAYAKHLDSLSGYLQRFKGDLGGVSTALSQSGIIGPLKVTAAAIDYLVRGIRNTLQVLNNLTSGFGPANSSIREWVLGLTAAYAALRGILALQARGGLTAVAGLARRAETIVAPANAQARRSLADEAARGGSNTVIAGGAQGARANAEADATRATGPRHLVAGASPAPTPSYERRTAASADNVARTRAATAAAAEERAAARQQIRTLSRVGDPNVNSPALVAARTRLERATTDLANARSAQAQAERTSRTVTRGAAGTALPGLRSTLSTAQIATGEAAAAQRAAAGQVSTLMRARVPGANPQMIAAEAQLVEANRALAAARAAEVAASRAVTGSQAAARSGRFNALRGDSNVRDTARAAGAGVGGAVSGAAGSLAQSRRDLSDQIRVAQATNRVAVANRALTGTVGPLTGAMRNATASVAGLVTGTRAFAANAAAARASAAATAAASGEVAATGNVVGRSMRTLGGALKSAFGGGLGLLIALQVAMSGYAAAKAAVAADTDAQAQLMARPATNSEADIRTVTEAQQQSADAAKKASSGFFGSIANVFSGGEFAQTARDLQDLADANREAGQTAARVAKANARGVDPTIDFSSADNLNNSLQSLQDEGRSATTIFNAFTDALNKTGEAAKDGTRRLTANEVNQVTASSTGIANQALRGAATTARNASGGLFGVGLGLKDLLPGSKYQQIKGLRNLSEDDQKAFDTATQAATDQVLNSGVDVTSASGRQALTKALTENYSSFLEAHQVDPKMAAQIVQDATDGIMARASSFATSGTEDGSGVTIAQLAAKAMSTANDYASEQGVLASANPNETRLSANVEAQARLEALTKQRDTLQAMADAAASSQQSNSGSANAAERTGQLGVNTKESQAQLEQLKVAVAQAATDAGESAVAQLQAQAGLVQASIPSNDTIGMLSSQLDFLQQEIDASKTVATRIALQTQKAQIAQQLLQANADRGQARTAAGVSPYDLVAQADNKVAADAENLRLIQNGGNVTLPSGERVQVAGAKGSTADYNAQIQKAQDEQAAQQARQARDAAVARKGIDPRDTLGNDQADLNDLRSQYDALPREAVQQRAELFRQIREKEVAFTTDQLALAKAQRDSGVFAGDTVGQAAADVDDARAALAAALPRTADYFEKLKAFNDSVYALTQAQTAAAQQANRLKIDLTNPVQVAQQELDAARAALNDAVKAGAPDSVVNPLKEDVATKTDAADSAVFSQRLSDAQTADNLGRISHQAYLQYLHSEHDRLTERLAGMKSTDEGYRQAIDQLDQIDQAAKAAATSLNGQFNIGDIRVPTVYEVRRSIDSQMSGLGVNRSSYQTNQNVVINVNGADTASVMKVISGALSSSTAAQVASIYAGTTRKVGA